jgi:hypothetical protein
MKRNKPPSVKAQRLTDSHDQVTFGGRLSVLWGDGTIYYGGVVTQLRPGSCMETKLGTNLERGSLRSSTPRGNPSLQIVSGHGYYWDEVVIVSNHDRDGLCFVLQIREFGRGL